MGVTPVLRGEIDEFLSAALAGFFENLVRNGFASLIASLYLLALAFGSLYARRDSYIANGH